MIRSLACAFIASFAVHGWAAETSPGSQAETAVLTAAAHTVRMQAEAELAKLRTTIISERTALANEARQAQAQVTAAVARLRTATAEREATRNDISEQRTAVIHDASQLRPTLDTVLSAGGVAADGITTARELAALPAAERIARAEPGILARLDGLRIHLRLAQSSETVIARDGSIGPVPVVRLGQARAVALGDQPATRGFLTRTSDGNGWRVSGPHVDGIAGLLPVDVTGTLADQDGSLEHHRSFQAWLAAGRFFIWPIIATLITGLGIGMWRSVQFSRQAVDPQLAAQVVALAAAGEGERARALVADGRTPLTRVFAAGLAVLDAGREVREATLAQALIAEQPRLYQGLALLVVLAGIAPLLGLLGTVTGMIDLFAVIAEHGSSNAKSLSGAISEALTTTQAGMIAAIPLLLMHGILARIAERRMLRLEAVAMGLLGLRQTASQA